MLKLKRIGAGKNGSAHEHAILSFDPRADITVFCWTEPFRIYNKIYPLNISEVQSSYDKHPVYRAGRDFYKYLFDKNYFIRRFERDLYWFDKEVLSRYEGLAIHLFSFKNSYYDFENGIEVKKFLRHVNPDDENVYANHFTEEQNIKFAESIFDLIKAVR